MVARRRRPGKTAAGKSAYAWLALALVLVLGLAVSAYFYSGPYYQFDDGKYIAFAKQMLNGTFTVTQSPRAFGFLMAVIEALSMGAFGAGVLGEILPTVLEYAALVVLTFLVGRKLADDRLGLVGALLTATMPFVVQYTTRVVPDMMLGVLAGASLYALLAGIGKDRIDYGMMTVSGMIAGLGIFLKLGGAGIGVAVLVALLLLERKALPAFLLGFVVVIAIYAASFYLMTGGNISYLSQYSAHQIATNPSTLGNNLITMAVVAVVPVTIGQTYPIEMLFLLIIAGTYAAFKDENRAMKLTAVIFWFVFLYLFLGTESLSAYAPMVVVDRYLIVVAVPMALLGAYVPVGMYRTFSAAGHRIAAAAVLVLLLGLVFLFYYTAYSAVYAYSAYIRSLPP